MDIYSDQRIVLTLDAGGTNFDFNAFKGAKAMLKGIRKDANADNLELCLETIKKGFHEVMKEIGEAPVAISFAFPGPADYGKGIIGDLNNLPAFRGGFRSRASWRRSSICPYLSIMTGIFMPMAKRWEAYFLKLMLSWNQLGVPNDTKTWWVLPLGQVLEVALYPMVV